MGEAAETTTQPTELEALVTGIVSGVSEAVRESTGQMLDSLGVGQVDQSQVVSGLVERGEATPENMREFEAMETEEATRVSEQSARLHYGDGLRARGAWERHPFVRAIPEGPKRERYVGGINDFSRWGMAKFVEKDLGRADRISMGTYDVGYQRQLTTGGGGADIVPEVLEGRIITKLQLQDLITPNSLQYMSTNGNLKIPRENASMADTNPKQIAEGATIPETVISYDAVQLLLKGTKILTSITRELMEDHLAAVGLVENLSNQAARSMALTNNTQGVIGDAGTTATDWTNGILVGGTNTVANAGAVTRAELLALFFGLTPAYRQNRTQLRWGMGPDNLERISALTTDAAGGAPIYPNAAGGNQSEPTTGGGFVEGVQVLEFDQGIIGDFIWIGDMSGYSTLVQPGIRAETTTVGGAAFSDDLQSWKFVQRQDGAVSEVPKFAVSTTAFTS